MQRHHNFIPIIIALFISLFVSTCALATAGSFDYGYGVISKGMGGTGVADPEDSIASATNPAGLAFLSRQGDLGLVLFSPRRGYIANGVSQFGVAPGKNWSSRNNFLIPYFGFVTPVANKTVALGIALYGNGGMDTAYDGLIPGGSFGLGTGVYNAGHAGVDLKQLFLNLGIAWKPLPCFSIGMSFIPAVQLLILEGLQSAAGFSASPTNLSNNGTQSSKGLGYRFGVLVKPMSMLSVGASFQPRISMSRLTRYAGALPDRGSFDIPSTGTIGLSITPRPDIIVNADFQEIWFDTVRSYHGDSTCPVTGPPCLGTKYGDGFGWNNATLYKVGLQWKQNQWVTWRAGYLYTTQPVPHGSGPTNQGILNIIAPAVVQSHITLGFSGALTPCLILNANFMYAPKVSITGKNQFNQSQNITYFMRQYEGGASLSWKMDS